MCVAVRYGRICCAWEGDAAGGIKVRKDARYSGDWAAPGLERCKAVCKTCFADRSRAKPVTRLVFALMIGKRMRLRLDFEFKDDGAVIGAEHLRQDI